MRYYSTNAHYYTIVVKEEGCRTIQRDVLIVESALNEVVRYLFFMQPKDGKVGIVQKENLFEI